MRGDGTVRELWREGDSRLMSQSKDWAGLGEEETHDEISE